MVDLDGVRREHGYHRLRVTDVVEETADTRSYVLAVPDDLVELFAYRAGQFCTFRVDLDGDELLRSYSMSSAPETDAALTVTVKRVPGGRVSGWFHDHVTAGDVLEATKPAGVFCVRAGERPVVAFAGGSGVTPVMSIAKSVLAGSTRSIRLLYANRDRESVIFGAELDALRDRHRTRVELRHHFDVDGGFLDVAAITAFVGDHHDVDFYICGPTPFMDLVEHTLLDLGVDPDRISIERFVNAGQSSASASSPIPAPAPTPPEVGAEAETETETVTVILHGKASTIAYQAGDTLLETARRGGLAPPFSCEAGNCATCMARLHEGSATMRANNALSAEEVEEGWVLTCQGIPQGPAVTVEYEAF